MFFNNADNVIFFSKLPPYNCGSSFSVSKSKASNTGLCVPIGSDRFQRKIESTISGTSNVELLAILRATSNEYSVPSPT